MSAPAIPTAAQRAFVQTCRGDAMQVIHRCLQRIAQYASAHCASLVCTHAPNGDMQGFWRSLTRKTDIIEAEGDCEG